jgi:hypothetical protein
MPTFKGIRIIEMPSDELEFFVGEIPLGLNVNGKSSVTGR